MSRLQMAARAACCFVALISGQAYASEAAQCWQSYEVEAAKVRDLHIMLMLGALKCRTANPALTDKYEKFTTKKSDLLISYNNVLKTHFMRVGGISDGHAAYEQFNTRLGNTHSGAGQAGSYCQLTDTLLTLATDARADELPQLAQNFSESALGIDTLCEAAVPVTVEAMPATAPTTMAAAASAPAPSPALAPASAAGPAPALASASTAAPVASEQPVAGATPVLAKNDVPAPAPQSAAAALEAAAAALQMAAASLKTQSTSAAAVEKTTAEALPVAQPAVIQPAAATTIEPVS